jgi:hypothetical protein
MKNKFFVLAVLVVFVLGLAETAAAQSKFGFKLGGGLAYVGGGDINKGLSGISTLYGALLEAFGATVTGGYENLHLGLDFDGEFRYQITPTIAIGLGVGYLSASKSSSISGSAGSVTESLGFNPKTNAIPITLNFHYLIPAGSSLNFVLHAGAGYYLANLDLELNDEGSAETIDMSTGGFGFHGGAGLELTLSPHFALTFDVLGRYATASGLSGDHIGGPVTISNGKLWYYEANAGTLGTLGLLNYSATQPSGSGLLTVREAKLDFSGFSAKIGVLIRI